MKNRELAFLSGTFLFSDFSEKEISLFSESIHLEWVLCQKGDRIDMTLSGSQRLAFVYSGKCEVLSEKLVLNTLKKGDSFGILSIFSDEPYPTAIVAKKQCRIFFIEKTDLLALIEASPKIAMNVIRFLASRVTFLNQKVSTLGGSSVEEKCIAYLKSQYQKLGTAIPFPISAVARKIGTGRASLYRALDALAEKGVLKYEENTAKILVPNFFE
ncbi:MAG: Crp/Fnr family transcriptional regulator [Clostridia bacterium]|nr:Crp/Fnr family transcriptional regulator [Clostridia bacterium]